MRRRLLAALSVPVILLAGCTAGGTPKAVVPEPTYDFGDVLTTSTRKTHEFVISNEGTGDLKLGDPEVQLLEGC